MCRWLAYSGGPIHLDEVIFKTENSLIHQSFDSYLGETTLNGDGFGIGWYGDKEYPGIYKSIQPAWNNENLKNLSEQIKSNLFIAHVRATTGTAVQRSNCHPFRYKNWIFVHNGVLQDFHLFKRDLIMHISPHLFPLIKGSTDSEIMFYLALSFGMEDNPKRGVYEMVRCIEKIARKKGIEFPVQMTLGISDGISIFGFRYSSIGKSRSLFHSAAVDTIRDIAPNVDRFSPDTRALVSEPLGNVKEAWIEVPESSFIKISNGHVFQEEFHFE
jgi:predicted glutamine amidotransferase